MMTLVDMMKKLRKAETLIISDDRQHHNEAHTLVRRVADALEDRTWRKGNK